MPQFRIGETLPGAAGPLLRDLGLLAGFRARNYPRSLGRASIWGSGELVRADSFTDPQGPGWRLDRGDFEAWLVAEAKRGKAVRRLVECNCDYRGERPDRDRVQQRAKLLNHATSIEVYLRA